MRAQGLVDFHMQCSLCALFCIATCTVNKRGIFKSRNEKKTIRTDQRNSRIPYLHQDAKKGQRQEIVDQFTASLDQIT